MTVDRGSAPVGDRTAAAWQDRHRRISTRIDQLEARIRDLESRRGEFRVATSGGSTAEHVQRAREGAEAARTQLSRSVFGVVSALRQSARAHERAANAHEQLADCGFGDVANHRRAAAEHRAAALLDKVTADEAVSTRAPATEA
jgi:hypothetical protein